MMTRFEKARILGARALQLSLGAPSYVESDHIDSILIAEREMEQGKIPMVVRREEERDR